MLSSDLDVYLLPAGITQVALKTKAEVLGHACVCVSTHVSVCTANLETTFTHKVMSRVFVAGLNA